jgi:hypothetical protein
VNPDEGVSQPGSPPDTIKEYAWDLDGTGVFDGRGPGGYLIQLRVTDSTGTSFPASPTGDLSDVASAQVFVRSEDDPLCDCVDNLSARAKLSKVQLTWTQTGADHYNIYRSTISGGPYLKIGETDSTYSTYLYSAVTTGTTYYYVVRPAQISGNEACQSNQASARPVSR